MVEKTIGFTLCNLLRVCRGSTRGAPRVLLPRYPRPRFLLRTMEWLAVFPAHKIVSKSHLYRLQKFCNGYRSFVPVTEVLKRLQKFCRGYRSFVQVTEVLYSLQKFCKGNKILSSHVCRHCSFCPIFSFVAAVIRGLYYHVRQDSQTE